LSAEVHESAVIGSNRRLPPLPVWRRRRARWIVAGVATVLAILAAIATRLPAAAPKTSPAPPPIPVATTVARRGDIGVYLESIGTVTPVYTAAITSQVNGRIVAVRYREGQRLKKGDALIDIDDRPYRAALQQAQGALERDRNVLAQAQMDVQRYRAAWARNAIARQTLDDQEKIVLQAKGTVKNDEGTVQLEQVQVDYCHITSPIAGRVGLRLVDPGNVVQATGNVTLAVITQMQPITVLLTISQDRLGAVLHRLSDGARLAVDAFDRIGHTQIASGTLITVDNQIDTTTGTVRARARFDNGNEALFPNQFVNARLLVEIHRGVTLLDAAAIQQNGTESYVYVIEGGVAHLRKVGVGASDRGATEVTGVAPGDVIADSNFDRLHDGAHVAVRAAPAPAAGKGAP
jgi:multidrug efflux system membrane fusion protein